MLIWLCIVYHLKLAVYEMAKPKTGAELGSSAGWVSSGWDLLCRILNLEGLENLSMEGILTFFLEDFVWASVTE